MIKSTLIGLCLLLATQMTAVAEDMSNDVTLPFFGIPTCPVSGKAKASVTSTFRRHRVRYGCPGYDMKFPEEPNQHLARLTAKQKLAKLDDKVCSVMTDKSVTADGLIIFQAQILDTCCGGCAERFSKHPEKRIEAKKKKKMDKSEPSKGSSQGGGD